MLEIVGLRAGEGRSGIDAFYDFVSGGRRYSVPIELKSTTTRSVSTARDVGPAHIRKWRSRVWIFAFHDVTGKSMDSLLILGPDDMEPWIGRIESYIKPDFKIAEHVAKALVLEDMHIICGEKDIYSREDAEALNKRQWSADRYTSEMDMENGYSPVNMLEILRLRARYLIARGATLNNPHVPRGFLSRFRAREISAKANANELRAMTQAAIRSTTLASEALREVATV